MSEAPPDYQGDLESVPWWKASVIYQIYPRSFQDSDGDGIGDLPGLISRLDYLADLGVDALWLSPVYRSPMKDFGYDISDYRSIDPVFGTMEDFDHLLDQAHRRGIRIIMDMVLNHTSDGHPWFLESRRSRESTKRDWYLWHNGPNAPNNWLGVFGGRAWEWDPETSQCYFHSFLKSQPDLNWTSPALAEAVYGELRFWLDKGVDGFRFDAINHMVKDPELRSNPPVPGMLKRPYDRQKHLYDRDRPELHGVLKGLRRVLEEYPGTMSVGESAGDPELCASYLGTGRDELDLVFNFDIMRVGWDPRGFAEALVRWYAALPEDGWPTLVFSNHDQPRSYTRFGKHFRFEKARILALLLLTLRGTPFLYYGEETGMGGCPIPRWKMADPLGLRYWPFHPGRDPSRTPMQWDASPQAGFTKGKPWLPVSQDFAKVNVETETEDPSSLLSWYRNLIAYRRTRNALTLGTCRFMASGENDVLAWERNFGVEANISTANFCQESRRVELPEGNWKVVVSGGGIRLEGRTLELDGLAAVLLEK